MSFHLALDLSDPSKIAEKVIHFRYQLKKTKNYLFHFKLKKL